MLHCFVAVCMQLIALSLCVGLVNIGENENKQSRMSFGVNRTHWHVVTRPIWHGCHVSRALKRFKRWKTDKISICDCVEP